MVSEIRNLLAAAQRAEVRGDLPEATRLLRQAAGWYSERALAARAEQMLRHAARLEGPKTPPPSDDFGFGDELDETGARPAVSQPPSRAPRIEQRGPTLADSQVEAWCSFCCGPSREVGALVTGPTGAFICRDCLEASAGLVGARVPDAANPPSSRAAPELLPSQARALERLRRWSGQVALLVGPPASGRSTLLRHLGALTRPPYTQLPEHRLFIDLPPRLAAEEEARLLTWLEEAPGRSMVIGAPGQLPSPSLVLSSEQGDEPVYDTKALTSAIDAASERLLALVDQVVTLEAPDVPALEALAQGLLRARGVVLPEQALRRLVAIAVDSGRGAHEVAALARRIAPGRYTER